MNKRKVEVVSIEFVFNEETFEEGINKTRDASLRRQRANKGDIAGKVGDVVDTADSSVPTGWISLLRHISLFVASILDIDQLMTIEIH